VVDPAASGAELGGLVNTIRDRDIPMTIRIRLFMVHLLSLRCGLSVTSTQDIGFALFIVLFLADLHDIHAS
jgi:hypothetical protein